MIYLTCEPFRRIHNFVQNRPEPAVGRQGLDQIVGPEYSFGVFSMSRFAALSLVELVVRIKRYKQTDRPFKEVRIKIYKQTDRPFEEVIIFCDKQ